MSKIPLEKKVLSENDRLRRSCAQRYREQGILCVNFISSPGSGKTSLLERTLERFPQGERVAVLTGDIQTDNDARRLARFGFPVRQITTGGACHLDARMVERALAELATCESSDLLLVENVGNLVCPSSYDLGEAAKIVLLSVTEGEDKPLKYPAIFHRAGADDPDQDRSSPYVAFDLAAARENARAFIRRWKSWSCLRTTGEGFEAWLAGWPPAAGGRRGVSAHEPAPLRPRSP